MVRRLLSVLTTGAVAAGVLAAPASVAAPSTGIDLRPDDVRQTIEGFGYASAFQRATLVHDLPEPARTEALDLLLGEDGAAPSILRLGIGAQSHDTYDVMLSIQPEDPGGPDAEPRYVWDGWDNGEVWFAKEAQARGVERFYGDAWSAPGYMKTNGTATQGGTLCGLTGTECASGDWTQAYANYLVAWADFYRQEGIDIDSIAFTNEPDWTTSYESMRFTPAQAAEFTRTFGPVAKKAGYGVVCCESFGWEQGKAYVDALEADRKASRYVSAYSAHSYASRSQTPVETDTPVWMSEWASSATGAGWNEAWDGDGDAALVTDGIVTAEHIQDALAEGDVNAYFWWLGASKGASASLLGIDPESGTYHVSKRYHAFAAFSRFIRPGAQRFDVAHDVAGLKVSAFENADGSQVVQLLNTSRGAVSTDIDLRDVPDVYLTDDDHGLELVDGVATKVGRRTTALELPARSLVTLVVPPGRR